MGNLINLLVIDDDDINVFITKKTVERTEFKVNIVSQPNGQLAIDYLSELLKNQGTLPNLIFLDINMPILDGWEFINEYDNLGIKSPIDIFMLTSSVFHKDMEKAKDYKTLKGFISKPLLVADLSDIMKNIGLESEVV